MTERNDLTYDVLSDVGAKTAREYGLVFTLPDYLREPYRTLGHPLPAFNGTDDWELVIPATLVIDRKGTVRFAEGHPDYTVRPDPDKVLRVLRAIT